jgi:general stress protein CsbA
MSFLQKTPLVLLNGIFYNAPIYMYLFLILISAVIYRKIKKSYYLLFIAPVITILTFFIIGSLKENIHFFSIEIIIPFLF